MLLFLLVFVCLFVCSCIACIGLDGYWRWREGVVDLLSPPPSPTPSPVCLLASVFLRSTSRLALCKFPQNMSGKKEGKKNKRRGGGGNNKVEKAERKKEKKEEIKDGIKENEREVRYSDRQNKKQQKETNKPKKKKKKKTEKKTNRNFKPKCILLFREERTISTPHPARPSCGDPIDGWLRQPVQGAGIARW